MKINDSTFINPNLASSHGVGKSNKQANIKPVVSVVDENNNTAKNLSKDKPRFDVNEKALELLEQQSDSAPIESAGVLVEKDHQHASSGRYFQSQTFQSKTSQYDQPTQQNLSAVAVYESVDTIAQKENIKQVFGISLFA